MPSSSNLSRVSHRGSFVRAAKRKAFLAAALLMGLGGQMAQAATQYWDTSTAANVQATSGTFGGTFWTQNGTTLAAFTTTNSAIFAGAGAAPSSTVATNAGTDATAESIDVSVAAAATAVTLSFNNTGYLLDAPSAQTLNLTINNSTGSTTPGPLTAAIWVAAGKSASIGNNLTVLMNSASFGSAIGLDNGATLNINSGAIIDRTANANRDTVFRVAAGGTGTVNIAGTVRRTVATDTGQISIGSGLNTAPSGTVIINVNNGGLMSTAGTGASNGAGSINLGNQSGFTGTMNINNGGTVTASDANTADAQAGVKIGAVAGSTGNLTLNTGGTLNTQKVFSGAGTSNFIWNGGTLKPNVSTTSFLQGLTSAKVQSGGGILDTSGFTVTVGQALLTDAGSPGGGLTVQGGGAVTLSGANTYTGNTSVSGSTKLVVTGSLAGGVNLTSGTLDGTGTVGGVTIGSAQTIANGNAGNGALTMSSLTFSGTATANVRVNSSAPGLAVSGAVTTAGAGTVTVNPTSTAASWSNGYNDLISGTGITLSAFTLGTTTGTFTGRQANGGLAIDPANNNLALNVIGDSPVWSGAGTGLWTTATTGNNTGPNDWGLLTAHTATNFWANDSVQFNNTYNAGAGNVAPATTTVTIHGGNVSPSTVAVNSSLNYTFQSDDGSGIAAGSLSKSGSGQLTITSANSYTGGTTLSAGTLNVNNNTALGTGALTITGGAIDSTLGGTVLTNNNTQNWNGDFTFGGSNALDLGTGNVTIGGATGTRTVTLNNNSTLTTGKILDGGTHGLTINGSGSTLIVTGVGAGAASSVINGNLTVGAGATLQINRTAAAAANSGDFTATGLSGTGTIVNGAAVERWLFINNALANTFDGTLDNGPGGAGLGLNKSGVGTLTLSSSSTLLYTGATTVGAGTLAINAANLGIGTNVTLAGGGNLSLGAVGALGTSSLVTTTGGNTGTLTYKTDAANNAYDVSWGSGTTNLNVVLDSAGATTTSQTIGTRTTNGVGRGTLNVNLGGAVTSGTLNITAFNMGAGSTGSNTIINPGAGTTVIVGSATKSINNVSQTLELSGVGTGHQVTGSISNGVATGANNVSLVKSGASTWSLLSNNTYTGTTTISGGTLVVGDSFGNGSLGTGAVTNNATLTFNLDASQTRTLGAVAGTTGTINNNGGSMLVFTGNTTNVVNINAGTLDGTASIGNTTIASGATIANGNGASGALTMSSLTFAPGTETANVRTASPGLVVTGALTSTGATVTLNPTTTTGLWSDGANALITYGSFTGSLANFTLGSITGTLGPRQAYGGLVNTGSAIALQINGDSPKWTGALSSEWSTNTLSVPRNWKLITGGTSTDFLTGDIVRFDDTATSFTANISAGSVSATAITFDNSTHNYTINGSGGGISGGSITKTGTGTLTINSVNTSGDALTVNQGTVVLTNHNSNGTTTVNAGATLNADFSVGNTSSNILSPAGNLALGGGSVNIIGHASAITTQSVTNFILNSGGSTVNVTNNGADVTANLGTLTRNTGGAVVLTLPAGTQTSSNGIQLSNANTNGIYGPYVVINGSGAAANNSSSGRTFASNDGTGLVVPYTGATPLTGTALWTASDTGQLVNNFDVAWNGTATMGNPRYANTVRFTDVGGTINQNSAAQLVTSGIMNAGTGLMTIHVYLAHSNNFQSGGVNSLVIDSGNAGFVFTKGVNINGTYGSGDVTIMGSNTVEFNGADDATSTYTGQTTVAGGTFRLSGAATINASSGITINGPGAKFVDASSAASTPAITVTQGTLDGTGTVGAVTVNNALGSVTNGNGTTSQLTVGSLAYTASGSLTARLAGGVTTTAAINDLGALSTSGNKVTVNFAGPTTPFVVGTAYHVIDYAGTFTGSVSNFQLGTGISARSIGSFANTGSAITFTITATDSISWSGVGGQNWTTATSGDNTGPNSWATTTGHAATNFWAGDDVSFNDTYQIGASVLPPSTTAVIISGANVSPASVTFNNSAVGYTISSPGGFGIASGSITKNGSGSVTLTTNNTTTGSTTINGGTLRIGDGTTDGSLASTSITNNAALVYNLVGAQTSNSTISGTGSLQKLGNGSLTLPSATMSSGGVTVNGGTLVANAAALSAGNITIGAAGTLTFIGVNAINTSTITGTGNILNNTANTIILKGDSTGFAGNFNHTAGGNNTQFNSNVAGSQNAAYTLTAGELIFAGVAGDPGVDANGNYTVKFGSLAGVAGNIRGGNSAVGTTTLEVGNLGTDTTIAANLNSGGAKVIALTKVGNGTLTLSGANTYSGGTLLNAGTIEAQSTAALGPSGNITFGGGTLRHSAANTTDYSARILNSTGPVKIDTNGQAVSYGAIGATNTGGLTKQGTGALVLTANNTFTGATSVNGGTLAYGASQTNVASGINVASGATAGIVAAGDTTGTINPQPALVNGAGDPSGYVPGDKYVIANNVTVAAGGKFDVNDGILVINNGTFSAVNAAVHAGRIFSSTSQYDANNLLGLTGLGMGDNFDLSYAGIGANNQLTITGSLIPAATDFGQQFIFKYTYIGDANLDGKVTTSDYDFVFGNLGSTTNGVTGNPVIWGDGDFNGNGVVDTTDLDNLFANLGFGTTGNVQPPLLPGTSVPEPSSVALLLLGLAGSAAVIRRKK